MTPHDRLIFDNETNDQGQDIAQSKLCKGEQLVPGTGILTENLKKGSLLSTTAFCLLEIFRARLQGGKGIREGEHAGSVLFPHQMLERSPEEVSAES